MRFKVIPVLLLMLLQGVSTTARMPFVKIDSDDSGQESSLEDERRERNFAIQVIKRLKSTDDFAPLLREFFVRDYVIHLKYFYLDQKLDSEEYAQSGIERRVLTLATHDDFRRAYVTLMNGWNQYDQLHEAVDGYVSTRNSVEGGDIFDARYRQLSVTARDEALTPAFYSVANTNPLLSILISSLISGVDNSDEAAYNARIKAATIRTVRGLRAFIFALTKCVDLMRKAVRKLRTDQDKLRVGRVVEYKSDQDEFHIYKYWTDTLEKRTFGLSAGTRLIYARIFPWEIVLTRRYGKLKVVAVYPDFDGD